MKHTQTLYHLPLSSQIIGEVFGVLRITYPSHLKKEMQRYFCGGQVHDDTREEILYILVDTLLKDGILPYPPVFEKAFECRWAFKKMLVRGISEYAEKWDATCAKLSHWSIPLSRKESLLVSCFRLVVIDLAVRLAVLRYLSKLPLLEQVVPLWAKRDGNITFLKYMKERCHPKPSNDELAGFAGVVNDKTKVNWFYKGKRPSRKHIQNLSRALAETISGVSEYELFVEMNRHYALAKLCENIASSIGWDKVMELVGALYHQATRLHRFFEQDPKPVEENYGHYILRFVSGAERSYQPPWIKYLWDTEKDIEWRQDIICVGCVVQDWASRIIQMNFRFTGESIPVRYDNSAFFQFLEPTPDQISTSFDYVSASYVDRMIDGEMELWGGAGSEAYNWDEKAESQFRQAIQKHPNSAKVHLELGAYLGSISWHPSKIEEGFHECNRAAELQPKWELPRIEAANILLRVNNYQAALELLERAIVEGIRISPRLAYTTGFARMMNSDLEGALSMFEQAIGLKSDYALALDNAAYCSFRLGKSIEGRRYAKLSRRLGISTTYDMYDVGKTKQNQEPFPFSILCESVPCREKNCKERKKSEEFREQLRQGKR